MLMRHLSLQVSSNISEENGPSMFYLNEENGRKTMLIDGQSIVVRREKTMRLGFLYLLILFFIH